MGLNHLQSLICTYSADDLRPLMVHIAIFLVFMYNQIFIDNKVSL